MITIFIIFAITIIFFLFTLTKKATTVEIGYNVLKENRDTKKDSKSGLPQNIEEYDAVRDLTSPTSFNKRENIDPYTAMKFTYDLLEKWHLL